MKHLFIGALLAAGISLLAQPVLECNFTPEEMKAWKLPPCAKVVQRDGGYVLEVNVTESQNNDECRAILPVDFKALAGSDIRMEAEIELVNVSKPRAKYNGTKFMMVYSTESGSKMWRHENGQYGTKDWKPIRFSDRVPKDVVAGTVELGLQDCSGIVRFRKFRLSKIDASKFFPQLTSENYRCVYTDVVTKEPVRRGVMSTGDFRQTVITEDLPDLKSWGGNLYRWQLIRGWGQVNDSQDPEEYLEWVRSKVPGTLQVLNKAHELGIRVVLDLHVAPGGRNEGGFMNMFEKQIFADTYLKAWEILATAVKGHPALFGYDLINEPNQPRDIVAIDYLTLQYRAAQVVRSIDPVTPLIIESNGWDSPDWYNVVSPLPMKDVIYQAHMYIPGQYTHQGVGSNPKGGDLYYPNPERGFTKDALRAALKPVRDFQLKHGARIYIGEFSAIRWAKGAEFFLEDCISLFEEYGWDWSYHAFREWDGWSVEHTEDPDNHEVATYETARKKALLKGLSYNKTKK